MNTPKKKVKITLETLAIMVANGFTDVRNEMKNGFDALRGEMKTEFNRVDDRMDGIEERLIRMEHNHGARIEILEDRIAKR